MNGSDEPECTPGLPEGVVEALVRSIEWRGIVATARDVGVDAPTLHSVIEHRGKRSRAKVRSLLIEWHLRRSASAPGASASGRDEEEWRAWPAVLAAVRRNVAQHGLRLTARQVGVSAGGLRAVLDLPGRKVREGTRTRLLAWYAQHDPARVSDAWSVSADLLSSGVREPELRARLRAFLLRVVLQTPSAELLEDLERCLAAHTPPPSAEEPR